MRRILPALIVAGALVAPATTVSAEAAPAVPPGLGIKLLEAPKSLANDPRAHIYVIDHLAPGARITRRIQVSDGTKSPLSVSLYAAGSHIVGGQWSPFGGHQQDELSQWTTVQPSTVQLQPGTAANATITVSVPADASRGERYAVIWAQAAIPSSSNVHEVARVGIREYVSVGPGGAPPTNFRIDSLTAARTPDGHPEVLAEVHNVGGRAIDLSGSLRLDKGPGGLSAGPFPAKLGTTLGPGQSEPVTVLLDKALPAGPWHARIELQSDLIRRAAEGTITFPSGAGTQAAPVKATAVPLTKNRNVIVPVALGLILLALIGLILFFLYRRRRRDEEEQNDENRTSPPRVPGQRAAADEQVHR